ncbi:hypothetical protein APSETT444_010202 [Aspergillus pseudonomiae]
MEALQPFVHLANSNSATSPKFVANLITNATSSPNTYVFAELLETPTVQALRSKDTPAEYQGYLTLLEIFAWGTWQDYQTPSELESLVTTAIYSSLITARLSPATNPPTINVTSVAPLRDVKPQSLTTMISILTQWETRCGDVISDIEAEIAKIKTDSAKRRAKEQARSVLIEQTLSNWGSDGGESNPRFPGSKKQGWHGGVKGGSSGFVGNKREFSGDDFDDGYWDNGADGAYDSQFSTSKMDIDQGAGSSVTGSAGAGARHAKRVLGRKT